MPKCRCGKIYDPKRSDFKFAMGGDAMHLKLLLPQPHNVNVQGEKQTEQKKNNNCNSQLATCHCNCDSNLFTEILLKIV